MESAAVYICPIRDGGGNGSIVGRNCFRRPNAEALDLLDDDSVAAVGEMDVVFCRNVLIYFDQPSRRKVIDTFHRKLSRRGYLLLGHSESLVNLSTAFELVHLERDMVYRKP